MSQPMKQSKGSDARSKLLQAAFVAVCVSIGVLVAVNLPIDSSPYGQVYMQPWIMTTEDRICDFGDPGMDGNVPVYGQIGHYTLPTSANLDGIVRGKLYSIEYKPSEGNAIVGLSDVRGKSSLQYLDTCRPQNSPPSDESQPVEPTN